LPGYASSAERAAAASIARRQVVGALLGALAAGAAACGGWQGVAIRPTPPAPLALDPLVDLVPAAGLVWIVDARPREILASAALAGIVVAAAPGDRVDAFARRFGLVDPLRADQVVFAAFPRTTLALARLPVQEGSVEAAFRARAGLVEGGALERGVFRLWGTVGQEREQVAVFGAQGIGIERGAFGPLQAAEFFAQGRLKLSLPALRAAPLAAAAARLGDGPLRAFAPGPFEGDWARGLGGLLGGATALAARLRPGNGPGAPLSLRLLLLGAWGADAPAASERLAAAFHVLAEDPLGRLTGLDRPVEGPTVTGDADALALDVALDPVTLGRGVRAVTGADLPEIMTF
jgi:hypothetical protein